MPISGTTQPEIIQIDETLRLRKFDGVFDFAFAWYQDVETVYLVDGVKKPYSMETLTNMYRYLNRQGELYFIEVAEDGRYRPIGDVTFWQEDLPIVIGDPAYRGRKIGARVIETLKNRARDLGYQYLRVGEIYDWNPSSRRCFEHAGFRAYEKTEKGSRYELNMA